MNRKILVNFVLICTLTVLMPKAVEAACGNGVLEGVEACDDGNIIDSDDCSNQCTIPSCGDAICQAGENPVFCPGDCPALEGAETLLVVLKLPEDPSGIKAATREDIQTSIFGHNPKFHSLAKYYEGVSQGRFTVTGTVLDWDQTPTQEERQSHNYVLEKGDVGCSCTRAAFPKTAFVAEYGANGFLPTHEFSHLLISQEHDNSLRNCQDPFNLESCRVKEYGNSFSLMGFGSGHINPLRKIAKGWFYPSNIKIVTENEPPFVLEPVETNTTGLKILEIPRGDGTPPLYIEYRQSGGGHGSVDPEFYNGAIVYVGSGQAVEADPDSPYWDLTFPPGTSITDPFTGTIIDIIANDVHVDNQANSRLTVKVSLGKPDLEGPQLILVDPQPLSTVSDTITVQLEVNDDSGVEKVEVSIGDYFAETLLQANAITGYYDVVVPTALLPNGDHEIRVKAWDFSCRGISNCIYNNKADTRFLMTFHNEFPDDVESPYPEFLELGSAQSYTNPFNVRFSVKEPQDKSTETGINLAEIYIDHHRVPAISHVETTPGTMDVCLYKWIMLPAGTHTLNGKVRDYAGNETETGPVQVTINPDLQNPTINIESLVEGQTVSGIVDVAIHADDNALVQNVEYYLDGRILNLTTNTFDLPSLTDNCDPSDPLLVESAVTESFALDTTRLPDGHHIITVRAVDNSGNASDEMAVTVNVVNRIQMAAE